MDYSLRYLAFTKLKPHVSWRTLCFLECKKIAAVLLLESIVVWPSIVLEGICIFSEEIIADIHGLYYGFTCAINCEYVLENSMVTHTHIFHCAKASTVFTKSPFFCDIVSTTGNLNCIQSDLKVVRSVPRCVVCISIHSLSIQHSVCVYEGLCCNASICLYVPLSLVILPYFCILRLSRALTDVVGSSMY